MLFTCLAANPEIAVVTSGDLHGQKRLKQKRPMQLREGDTIIKE